MYLINNSAEEILQRMKENAYTNTDEGTFIHDAFVGISEELFYTYTLLEDIYNRSFAETALENEFSLELENRCAEFGVNRKDGTKAIGAITFIGKDGTRVPKGTIVQTLTGLKFITLKDEILENGEKTVECEANSIGANYNVTSGRIVELEMQIPGILGVINRANFTGGTDKETDRELFERYKLKLTTPATSGNEGHYKLWALEVPGVGAAKVIPTWNGGGTVKVIVIDSDKRSPSQLMLDNIFNNIERQRPIGATVTVVGAEEIPININAKLQLSPGSTLEEVREEIIKGANEYIKSIAFKDNIIRYTRVANILLDIPYIVDYFNLTVNLNTANIEIPDGSIPVVGEVVIC